MKLILVLWTLNSGLEVIIKNSWNCKKYIFCNDQCISKFSSINMWLQGAGYIRKLKSSRRTAISRNPCRSYLNNINRYFRAPLSTMPAAMARMRYITLGITEISERNIKSLKWGEILSFVEKMGRCKTEMIPEVPIWLNGLG